MADLVREFNRLTGGATVINYAPSILALKDLFENLANQADELQEQATNELETLQENQEELKASMGLRDKFLGGRLGGNREKAEDNVELIKSIESLNGLVENLTTFQDTLGNDTNARAADLIAITDSDFAQSLEFQSMMIEAVEFTEQVLTEIDEALEALNNAENAEEWDQMTDSVFADMDSDDANAEAADEVNDVTVILVEYREFLGNIGENVAGLYGSDFDFDWGDMMNESFFGDFWGGSMMLDKIAQGQDQMLDLREKIYQLYESFGNDCDHVCEEIETRVNEEWDNV